VGLRWWVNQIRRWGFEEYISGSAMIGGVRGIRVNINRGGKKGKEGGIKYAEYKGWGKGGIRGWI